MAQLFSEAPVTFLPALAVELGINEAILLQTLHNRIIRNRARTGTTWAATTFSEWEKLLPFFSGSTIRRTVDNLRELGYVQSKRLGGGANTYTIDYERLTQLQEQMEAR